MNKERPIIFGSDMVRAILDGRKTQTRRVIKPQPVLSDGAEPSWSWRWGEATPPQLSRYYRVENFKRDMSDFCPYGKVGDRLMPRWASRITLEVVSVRAERLREITTEDALAEGITKNLSLTPRVQFAELWDSINAKRGYGWDSNPWVWVIEFERIEL